MKKFAKRCPASMFAAFHLALVLFLSQSNSASAQNQNVQVIEITAKKYEYSKSPIHVKIGTKLQLEITATDHDHGFKIGTVPDDGEPNGKAGLIFTSPQDCWQLKKGETTTIEFLAQTPGKYTFKCCHTCGLGHRGMKGQCCGLTAHARAQKDDVPRSDERCATGAPLSPAGISPNLPVRSLFELCFL